MPSKKKKEPTSIKNITKPIDMSDSSPTHVRFVTLSQSNGSMEQFVTSFNQFCRRKDIDIRHVRLHEEYDESMSDIMSEIEDIDNPKPYIDIIHDIVAEIWFSRSEGPAKMNARIFVTEDFADELMFYKAINDFCESVDVFEVIRAGSPYNRSLVAIYRGDAPDEGDRLLSM